MYGKTGSSNYNDTHANINDSTIKKFVDNWYTSNLSQYSTYLADNIFCNDRKISTYTDGSHGTSGYGTKGTYYRWARGPWDGSSYGNMTVSFTCSQKNDAFTVNDTTKGNGALTYGIGLLTADEAALAGGWSSSNYNYYLYSGQNYWLASPSYFDSDAYGYLVYYVGYLHKRSVDDSCGARPVINLSSEILKNGDGTASNPYHA